MSNYLTEEQKDAHFKKFNTIFKPRFAYTQNHFSTNCSDQFSAYQTIYGQKANFIAQNNTFDSPTLTNNISLINSNNIDSLTPFNHSLCLDNNISPTFDKTYLSHKQPRYYSKDSAVGASLTGDFNIMYKKLFDCEGFLELSIYLYDLIHSNIHASDDIKEFYTNFFHHYFLINYTESRRSYGPTIQFNEPYAPDSTLKSINEVSLPRKLMNSNKHYSDKNFEVKLQSNLKMSNITKDKSLDYNGWNFEDYFNNTRHFYHDVVYNTFYANIINNCGNPLLSTEVIENVKNIIDNDYLFHTRVLNIDILSLNNGHNFLKQGRYHNYIENHPRQEKIDTFSKCFKTIKFISEQLNHNNYSLYEIKGCESFASITGRIENNSNSTKRDSLKHDLPDFLIELIGSDEPDKSIAEKIIEADMDKSFLLNMNQGSSLELSSTSVVNIASRNDLEHYPSGWIKNRIEKNHKKQYKEKFNKIFRNGSKFILRMEPEKVRKLYKLKHYFEKEYGVTYNLINKLGDEEDSTMRLKFIFDNKPENNFWYCEEEDRLRPRNKELKQARGIFDIISKYKSSGHFKITMTDFDFPADYKINNNSTMYFDHFTPSGFPRYNNYVDHITKETIDYYFEPVKIVNEERRRYNFSVNIKTNETKIIKLAKLYGIRLNSIDLPLSSIDELYDLYIVQKVLEQ